MTELTIDEFVRGLENTVTLEYDHDHDPAAIEILNKLSLVFNDHAPVYIGSHKFYISNINTAFQRTTISRIRLIKDIEHWPKKIGAQRLEAGVIDTSKLTLPEEKKKKLDIRN